MKLKRLGMTFSDLITQKEAAAILNRSVSAVSRVIKDGRLEYADPKNRPLRRPSSSSLSMCQSRSLLVLHHHSTPARWGVNGVSRGSRASSR